MSVKVKYKGEEILSINTNAEEALATEGKYCEGDIEVINTQDGGITPSGSIEITENGTHDVTEFAEAVVNVQGGGGGGGVVTGTFTLASKSVGLTVNHNANISGDYFFVFWMQQSSFEALEADTANTSNYDIGAILNCTNSFHNFGTVGASKLNLQGTLWSFKPSTGAFSASISPNTFAVSSYTANRVVCPTNYGFHKGTYDFWAIPLN